MISTTEWLINLSKHYSVQQLDDVKSGTLIAKIKNDIYLMNHEEVKE